MDRPPVEIVVNNFYSSAMMNIITWEKAYCLFPLWTVKQRVSSVWFFEAEAARLKLESVGFDTQPKSVAAVERRVGDSLTLVVPLERPLCGKEDGEIEKCRLAVGNSGVVSLLRG